MAMVPSAKIPRNINNSYKGGKHEKDKIYFHIGGMYFHN